MNEEVVVESGLKLQKEEMDVLFGTDGRWHGKNAAALELALSNDNGFTWPKRLTNISLSDGKIIFKPSNGSEDQTHIPAVWKFFIVAPHGARLRADYLSEIFYAEDFR